jgi:hypothetical protein
VKVGDKPAGYQLPVRNWADEAATGTTSPTAP